MLGLQEVYHLELGTYPLIERMARIGVLPDLQHFASLSLRLAGEIDRLRARLCAVTENPNFNANSGDQVAALLFDDLGLDGDKRTHSGRFSTNDKILEGLDRAYPDVPAISDIRTYRELYKLKYTFVDRIPDFCHRWPYDGRIHASFRTTRVVTGRLAASDPNLLAPPKRGTFARDFRRGWIAGEGHVLCSWDQSQVELRGLAHLSQDPVMLAVYRGESRNPDGSLIDLHSALVHRIFGIAKKADQTDDQRVAAKAINFGLPMGMTFKGLAGELRKNGLDVDENDAQRWIDETMALYTGVPVYQQAMIEQARRQGYIRCLSGRIRYIGGINSRDERVRAEAERLSFATPVQESAQLIMKQAEAQVYRDILQPWWKWGLWVEPLLQIHDALQLEVADGLQHQLHAEMQQAMTQVPKAFTVPLAVEGEWGLNLAETTKL